jgi:hypothetical protein
MDTPNLRARGQNATELGLPQQATTGRTNMTQPSPGQADAPPPKGKSVTGKVVAWVIAALIIIPILAVVGTYLSIFFIGYNR